MRNSESSGKQPIQDVETLRQHKLKTERLRRKVTWQKKMQTANGVDKPQAARRTGIDIVGNVPWGTHLCVFYQDKQDLIDILVPYFKAGLENNEFCMWITSEPLNAKEAELSLRQAVNNLDDYIEKGQIEILDYTQWYTKSGRFEADEVLQDWSEKYEQAIERGFDGLRATGNALWLDKRDWLKITRYEAAINNIFDDCRVLAICNYSLNKCGTSEVIDVVCNHQFALIRRDGRWELVESSELRNVTKALQNALKQWETTFNTTQDSIILIDPDFTILKANMATSNLLGKPLDDVLGSKCYELFHGTNAPPDICPHKKVKETKKQGEMELHIPDRDIWIAISTDPILDENGNMSGMVHVVRNITEKKKMMEALRDSKEKIHSFLELSPDFIIIVDTDHTIQFINRTASGQEVEKVIGKSAYEFIESRYHEDVRKALSQTFATGQSCSLVARGIDTNGKKRWFENRLAPIKHNGLVVAVMVVSTDITKRRKAEEKLKQSREFLNNTINALDDTFFVKDEEHRWTVLNDAACKAIGRPREELIGKSDYDLFPKEQADMFWEKDNLVLKTGKTNITEEEVTWQGKLHTISTKKSVFKDFITGKQFIVGTARDITERKQMEKTLREKEQRYRSFVENFHGIAFRGKMNFTPIFFHGVVEQMTGYTVDEFLSGKPRWNQIIHEDDMNIITGTSGKRIAEIPNSSVEREYRIVRKDGQIRWVHEFIRNICDDSGKPAFVEGIIYDISERKKAEEALHESEQKYRALIEQSMHGIIILQDYRIVFANKAACEIPGLTMQEMHDLSLEDMMSFIPPENRATIRQRLKDRFAGRDNVPQNYELRLLRRNGEEFWLNMFFSPIDYQGRPAIQLAFTDITDQKRMEETLRRSEKRFREIFENTAVGIYRTTPDGQILMANPTIVHMLGYPSFEELSQRNLEEEGFEPQYRRSTFKEEIEQKGRIDGWESVWSTRDGKMLNVIENARAVRDEDGKIIYYEGTAENITERKKAEEALRESEQRYRAIFEQAADSIVLVDVETGELVEFNDRAHKNLGYTREEFRNLKIPDFDAIESAEDAKRHLEYIIKTGLDSFETKHRTKAGEIRNIQISSRAISIRDKDFVQSIWYDITDRKKAEEALIESEEKFRNLAEQSPNMIFINKRGRVVYANKQCEEVMGYKREEFYHPDFDFMTLIAPEYTQFIKTNFSRHMKGEEINPYEYGLITKNGERLDTIITTKLIKYDGEDSILGTITDITERKKAQAALAESEQRFRKFFENEPEYCYMVSPQGTILEVNAAALNALGYSREEIVGKPIATIYAPESHERMRRLFGQWQKIGEIRDEEMVIITRNGDRRNVLLSAAQVLDETGKALHTVSIQRDITERKRTQEALRESEVTARALLNATTDAVLLIDKEGLIIDANEKMSEWLGHTREDLIGTIIYDHLPSEIAEQRKAKGYEIVRTGRPISFEDQREGRWLENSVYPILDSHGEATRFAIYSRDITERKQAEEKLLDYQEQLKSLASQLTLAEERERRQIATELHDEISQSLFISKMKLEALDKSAPDKKYDDTLDEINTSLGRIIAAMRSLTFDLSSPILYEFGFEEAVAEWLNEQVEKKHGIATEFEDDGLPKQMDDDIRVILFRNVRELLINVIKHSRAKKAKVSIQKVGSRIRISVEDDGVGFDSARAESLITKKEAFGLFSIQERLEHLGGNLQIESSPGCGCRITITSPLKREDIREG